MKLSEYVRGLDSLDKLLYVSFFISSAAFLGLLIPFHPYPFSYLLKAVPMVSLCTLLLKNVRNTQGILFSIGILFSMCGDITLDIDRNRYFMIGLIFFLIAHIFYIITFVTVFKFNPKRLWFVVPILLYTVILTILFSSIPIEQRIPVLIYLCIISLMTIFSPFTPYKTGFVFTGALVFMLSDTIIAINKFFHPIPYSTFFNIGLYFIAQVLLVSSIVFYFKRQKLR
jgi:uncharacterized membrane protein YhhN